MKKILFLLCILFLMLISFTACSKESKVKNDPEASSSIEVSSSVEISSQEIDIPNGESGSVEIVESSVKNNSNASVYETQDNAVVHDKVTLDEENISQSSSVNSSENSSYQQGSSETGYYSEWR